MNFDAAFAKLIDHEGGYVNNPADPGGETKFGISKRTYPAENIKALTIERAKEIYRHDFWAPIEVLPEAIRFDVFDMAVNSGVAQATRILQRAIGQFEDGIVGPQTMLACSAMSADQLVMRFNAHRLIFMAGLRAWPAFGRGWARRIAENLLK